jgi:hypothetical protein
LRGKLAGTSRTDIHDSQIHKGQAGKCRWANGGVWELRQILIQNVFDEHRIPGMENMAGNSFTICNGQLPIVMLPDLSSQKIIETICSGKAKRFSLSIPQNDGAVLEIRLFDDYFDQVIADLLDAAAFGKQFRTAMDDS